MAAFGDVEFQPAGGEAAEGVGVTEDEDVAGDLVDALPDAVEPGGDGSGGFAVGYRPGPDRPAGLLGKAQVEKV